MRVLVLALVTGFRAGLLLALLSVAVNVNAADFSVVQDWQTPTAWPVAIRYTASGSVPELLVVEESGIDLSLVNSAGSIASAPGSNIHGAEFFLARPGEQARFSIQETFSNSPAGSFRLLRLPLETNALVLAAQKLVDAGFAVSGGEQEALEAACADYYDIAYMQELPVELRQASAMLAAECDRVEGAATPPELLSMLSTSTHPLGFKAYHADWYRGRLAFSNEEYVSAERYFDLALSLAEADRENYDGPVFGIEMDIAALYVDKGSVAMIRAYIDGGEQAMATLDQAVTYLDQALAMASAAENHAIMGDAYRFKSAVALVRGQGKERLENLLLARDELRLAGNAMELMYILGSIGDYYKEWGDLQRAQESYLEALKIVEETHSENRTADPFHNMSTFYYTLGDFPRAKAMIEQAIEVYENLGNEARSTTLNFDLAAILIEQGQLQQALELLENVVAYMTAGPTPWDPIRIEAQSALASLKSRLGKPEEALDYSTEIYDYLTRKRVGSSGFEIVPVYVTHARLLNENRQPEQALAVLEEALATHAREAAAKIQVLAGMHDVYIGQDDVDSAIRVADTAFSLIESQQMEIESVRLGPYWNGKMQQLYMAHTDYLLEHADKSAGYAERAFAVVERARAASLRLRRQEVLLAKTQDDAMARSDWQALVESIRDAAGRQETDQDALRLERSISEARERFFLSYSNTLERLYPDLASLDTVSDSLDANTLVLEYIAGPEQVWRFDISAQGWRITPIGPADRVAASVDAALFEITSRPDAATRNADYLASMLFAGLQIDAGIANLLISPAGNMNSIPFAALSHNGRYIADQVTVTLLPSISEYVVNTGNREPVNDNLSLAVFADPVFGSSISADLAYVETDNMRSWSDTLERLPASALEARALSAFYDAENSLVLTGAEASKVNLFDERVRNADIIHIATHGYFNESLPELIGLALAPSDPADDGFVSMAEIASRDFNADLVVISACSTARGEVIPGEGNMSLARTFLAQGVNSVVSTLWPVSDSATALFMKEFYRAINEDNLSYSQALQKAQGSLRSSTRYRSPYYWGAYILTSAAH